MTAPLHFFSLNKPHKNTQHGLKSQETVVIAAVLMEVCLMCVLLQSETLNGAHSFGFTTDDDDDIEAAKTKHQDKLITATFYIERTF